MQAEDDKSDTYYYWELVRQMFCKRKDFFFSYDDLFFSKHILEYYVKLNQWQW